VRGRVNSTGQSDLFHQWGTRRHLIQLSHVVIVPEELSVGISFRSRARGGTGPFQNADARRHH
jgi:hypothetical protein